MKITDATHPQLTAAFRTIEEDNGGHLIGTVYPGEPMNLHEFDIPERYAPLVPQAEEALRLLKETSDTDWLNFVCGECTEQETIRRRQGNLDNAHELMNRFFEAWCED